MLASEMAPSMVIALPLRLIGDSPASILTGTWLLTTKPRETGESPHALFFLHGFNVSFEEAAIRAAQIGVDLKVPEAMQRYAKA